MTLDVESKRREIASSVQSRKRKLRELYAVAQYAEPIPQHRGLAVEVPYDNGEIAFLEANDITKGRYFNEATLPERPQSFVNIIVKQQPPEPPTKFSAKNGLIPSSRDGTRRATTSLQTVGGSDGRGTANELVALSNGSDVGMLEQRDAHNRTEPTLSTIGAHGGHTVNGDHATSQGHRNIGEDVPAESSTAGFLPSAAAEAGTVLERDRVLRIESPRGSPGVDPLEAAPMQPEDAAGSDALAMTASEIQRESEDPCTVHLPPLSEEPGPIRDREKESSRALVQQGKEDDKRTLAMPTAATEPLSSPVSAADPYSTTTPGVDAPSTHTSPDIERSPTREDVRRKSGLEPSLNVPKASDEDEHHKLLHSQMDIAREHAFQPSPEGAGDRTTDAGRGISDGLSADVPPGPETGPLPESVPTTEEASGHTGEPTLTTSAETLAKDITEEEEDEVVGVPTTSGDIAQAEAGMQPPAENVEQERQTTVASNRPSHLDAAVQDDAMDIDIRRPSEEADGKVGNEELKASEEQDVDIQMTGTADDMTRGSEHGGEVPDATKAAMNGDMAAKPPSTPLPPSAPHSTTAQHVPERMTTRVSSGAIRHKSVSEILGETPKSSSSHADRAAAETAVSDSSRATSASNISTPGSTALSPRSTIARLRKGEQKEKERSKLSTVIFAKPTSTSKGDGHAPGSRELSRLGQDDVEGEIRDYFLPLFAAQAAHQPQCQPLTNLLASGHKTLTTPNHYVDFHEQQDCRILKRIYSLQYANRWSLRQLERCPEPARPATHWDSLLNHMKWMRTDFREERKWKLTIAKCLADWCAEWVASTPEEKALLQVKRTHVTPNKKSSQDVVMDEPSLEADTKKEDDLLPAIPELVPSGENESSSDMMEEDDAQLELYSQGPPAAVFSLAADDVIFGVRKTPAADKLLAELPLYEPSTDVSSGQLSTTSVSADAEWKLPVIPLMKFVTGKIEIRDEGPPRTRSRYEYESEESFDEDTVALQTYYGSSKAPPFELPPEQDNVALFTPENKHIRDRIYAGHAFRPPSEHNMPSQAFFENRLSSQWTWEEDDQLRKLVREYSYNWSLISSILSAPSMYSSSAERRTPWECFERWVGLEGLPPDMQKTQYFRTYHSRLEAAQRNLLAQQQQSQQQQGVSATSALTPRRRTAQPVRVDRRKNSRHLAMIEAMRKLAKRRETTIQKQQNAAGLAAMRKANEPTQPRTAVHTPADFSRIKHERELKAEAYKAQLYRNAVQQQRSAQQSGQQSVPHNAPPQPQRNGAQGTPNMASPLAVPPPMPNGQSPAQLPSQPRPSHPLQVMQQNMPMQSNPALLAQMSMKAGQQPQMPANIHAQQRMTPHMTPENMRVYMEANHQQQQQRYLQQQQQQQRQQQLQHFQSQQQNHAHATSSSSPNLGNMNPQVPNGTAMLNARPAGPNANGMPSPSANGLSHNVAASVSPHLGQAHPNIPTQPQPLSSGMVPAVSSISHQLKARNPQLSNEQIQELTNKQLAQQYHRMSQAAMDAAAGNANGNTLPLQQNPALMGGVPPAQNQQLYAQMLRQQQASQSRAASVGPNGVRPPSRSGTPQTQRVPGQSQSPRPPPAQMAAGQ